MRKFKRVVFVLLCAVAYWLLLPVLAFVHLGHARRSRRTLVWGPVPIINNRYWSGAMKAAGWDSKTLMSTCYSTINRREDYDLYFEDLARHLGRRLLAEAFAPLLAHLYIARHAAVVHIPFSGGPLGGTAIWRFESLLYRLAGVKTVVIPYGADAHMYSRIANTSARNALLIDYPAAARNEPRIRERVEYWNRNADCVICGPVVHGMARWDVTVPSALCIDTGSVAAKASYSPADGRTGTVTVVHTPNHRGFKGTEYIIAAVERLRAEGLQVELRLFEKVQNREVLEQLTTADILVEQLIAGAYALSAIEGLAAGLAVLSNVEDEARATLFRRYAFLDECPILSTTPETVTDHLRTLVTSPQLREELGKAGRLYVEKYHSYESAQYLFASVYRRILDGERVDLMNLFHPLKSEYNRRRPRVSHPLVRNRLPIHGPERC